MDDWYTAHAKQRVGLWKPPTYRERYGSAYLKGNFDNPYYPKETKMEPEDVAIEMAWMNELSELESVVDMLSLIGIPVTVGQVNAWSAEQVEQAMTYAATASDNPGSRPVRPDFLPAEDW